MTTRNDNSISSQVIRDVIRTVLIIIIAQYIIFTILYSYEADSVLHRHGESIITAYIHWFRSFLFFDWGMVHDQGLKIVPLKFADNEVGLLPYVGSTLLYGVSGILLAVTVSTLLTYIHIFKYSGPARRASSFLSSLSGFHIIIFCFIIKIVLDHHYGFSVLLPISIGLGSYMYADIANFQHLQMRDLKQSDFMIAAKVFGDNEFIYARRSIALGLLSQWNSLVGTMFVSTVIVEIFFKIEGIGYAIERYLLLPNLQFPDLKVESELFMAISTVIITIIVILSLVKTILARVLSKGFIK